MLFNAASVALLSLFSLAAAQPVAPTIAETGVAIIIVEASHGGAGSGLTNTTINVPLKTVYFNDPALNEVSTLYLVGSTKAPVETVTCSTRKEKDGSGSAGRDFTVGNPSYLSTNTVVVGSIICQSTAL